MKHFTKFSWLVWLLVFGLAIAPGLFADDDDEDFDEEEASGDVYVVKGKGSSKKGAIIKAYKAAMDKHLRKNMNEDDYDANKKAIKAYLKRNWSNYVVGDYENPRISKRYRRRRITIRARIEGKMLLKDVKKEFTKARGKLEGFEAALISTQNILKRNKDEWLDRDVLFDYCADKLGKHIVIRNIKDIKAQMKREALTTGQLASMDPKGYLAKVYNQVQLVIELSVTTRKQTDPSGMVGWYANVSVEGKHPQTSRVLFQFQGETGFGAFKKAKPGIAMGGLTGHRKARTDAIKNVAKYAAKLMMKKIRTRRTAVRQNVYDLKFVGFDRSQFSKIDDALLDLSDGKRAYCKVLPGGVTSGSEKHVKIKWMKGKSSQHRVIGIIKEACAENEVIVEAKLATQSNITFQPGEQEDEEDD